MNRNNKKIITWTLLFEGKKIILSTERENFFVRTPLEEKFFHGDTVLAIVVKKSVWGKMPEVIIQKLKKRSEKNLIGRKIGKNIFPLPQISTVKSIKIEKNNCKKFEHIADDSLVVFRLENFVAHIEHIFEKKNEDNEVESILFLNAISTEWGKDIKNQEKNLQKNISTWKKIDENFREDMIIFSEKNMLSHWKNQENFPYFEHIFDGSEKRVDLRNWHTITIDGADAKDLDDAISIAKYDNGDFLLGVHIADVGHFVEPKSPIDQEAFERGTSIYLPNKVIPMLPESLCNHLCSLKTETEKKTLSCLVRIHSKTGKVLHADIFKSLIQSQKQGIYEEIFLNFQTQNFENILEKNTINTAFELFEIIKKRREKEGKMNFETTELKFDIDENYDVKNIFKRERNDAHMLIEECMVLANEEIAKWCDKRKIPYLSRFHDFPSEESEKIITEIIGPQKGIKNFGPKYISLHLKNLENAKRYHASRLILPKMSKAIYSHNRKGHFGLALDFYSHFTSPIRRYPDLVTHRMISWYLEKKLDAKTKKKYEKILAHIAEKSSEKEKKAENIENAVNKIYTLRYAKSMIGKNFCGKISGIAEWGFFVELENGIEITVYLPRFQKFFIDEIAGNIKNSHGKIIATIWEEKNCKILKILEREQRIIGEII